MNWFLYFDLRIWGKRWTIKDLLCRNITWFRKVNIKKVMSLIFLLCNNWKMRLIVIWDKYNFINCKFKSYHKENFIFCSKNKTVYWKFNQNRRKICNWKKLFFQMNNNWRNYKENMKSHSICMLLLWMKSMKEKKKSIKNSTTIQWFL